MPFVAIVYVDTADEAREIINETPGSVLGLYAFPQVDMMPTCSGYGCKSGMGWTRHPTNHHMVHACGKRNTRWFDMFRGSLFDHLGRNRIKNPPAWFTKGSNT